MTRVLSVQRNGIEYFGTFARPAFHLWGKGDLILSGLYEAFQGLGVNASAMRAVRTSDRVTDEAVVVQLGPEAEYRYRFDRVEATLSNFTPTGLDRLPDALESGAAWLRSTLPDFAFTSHVFICRSHSAVVGATSREVLLGLDNRRPVALGEDFGTGMILHGRQPDGEFTLTVDRSLFTPDGIYVEFVGSFLGDAIDYHATMRRARTVASEELKGVGLQFEEENEVP